MAHSQEWIFKKEFLEDVNSARFNHATDVRKEKENRFKTAWFIKDLSFHLRPLPTVNQRDQREEEAEYDIRNLKVLWTACTFFHRFYVFHSFDSHSRFAVAVACLFLASKVEEKPLRLSDHIFLYFRLRKNKILKKTDQEFKDMERDVLLAERILLQTLGFDLNVVHPYQYFRQIIGRELKSWFSDPDDSKQVLRLATTLLTDSFRSTLCLQYTPYQLALAFVFMAITIIGLHPTPSRSAASLSQHSPADVTWIDIVDKDVDEQALQAICFAMVDLYASGFTPAEIPYSNTSQLCDSLPKKLGALVEARKDIQASSPKSTSALLVETGVEEYKVSDEEINPNKRKQVSPTHAGSAISTTTTATGSSSKFNFKSLPPPFLSTELPPQPATAPSSSPCHDAPTPRAAYRPMRALPNQQLSSGIAAVANMAADTPELVPPPPESPMDSCHSTFSHVLAHTQRESQLQLQQRGTLEAKQSHDEDYSAGGDGDILNISELSPAGSVTDTPSYMPPPPDTPESMASTPNFDNLPRPGSYLLEGLPSSKKARVDY